MSFVNEQAEIEEVLRTYVRGYLNADAEAVSKAFHQDARLLTVEAGEIESTDMPAWLKNLDERRAKQDIREAKMKIGEIAITGTAAVARINLYFARHEFTDYLSLLQVQGRWQIVGKIYTFSARG